MPAKRTCEELEQWVTELNGLNPRTNKWRRRCARARTSIELS